MNVWQQLERAAQQAMPTRPQWRAGHLPRLGLAAALALLTYALFPASPAADVPVYEVGAVAADNVIAPFAFDVRKDPAALERERRAAASGVLPVYSYAPEAADTSRALLDGFDQAVARVATLGPSAVTRVARALGVDLAVDEATYLVDPRQRSAVVEAVRRLLHRAAHGGVAADAALDEVSGDITLRRGDNQRTVSADNIATFSGFLDRLRRGDGSDGAAERATRKLLSRYFRPTLVPDAAATERERATVRGSVQEVLYTVRTGEKIVGAHEVVGRDEAAKLRALQAELHGRRGTEHLTGRIAGAVLFNFLVLSLVGFTLVLFRPALYANLRAVAAIAAVYLMVLAVAAGVPHLPSPHPELIPIALAAVILGLLFDARLSLIATMVLAVLVGGQSVYRGTNALFISLIAGAAGAFSTRFLRRRNQAINAVLTIASAYALAAIALGLTLGWPLHEFLESAAWGAASAIVSLPVALSVLLPLAEQATGIETDLTLLEWSDLNRPLMRRLMLEAPGTHAHTMVIANLAEAAAAAIGANGLLARVGAYYHDIGKVKRPQYFIENQPKGRNPHDRLKPQTSATIIRGHVRDGLELAEEYHVPRALRAFISEHHGTGPISFFLEKAKERDASSVPNPSEYQYPGPAPQSAETAIVMLADGVEAATRALADPTPQRIRETIERIVKMRVDQGQLRDAPLTLRQLTEIKEQFERALIGQYHGRVDYPAASGGVTAEFAPV